MHRGLSPFVGSQRWKKSSSLNFEQSRPTSYGILLFYNCVLDYDKGHQTGEGEESLFLLPFLFFFLLLPFLSLSFSVDRTATEENGGFEYVFRVFSLSLSFSIPFKPPSFGGGYISADKWGEKKSARFETVVEWKWISYRLESRGRGVEKLD